MFSKYSVEFASFASLNQYHHVPIVCLNTCSAGCLASEYFKSQMNIGTIVQLSFQFGIFIISYFIYIVLALLSIYLFLSWMFRNIAGSYSGIY